MDDATSTRILRMSCLKSASILHQLSVGSPDQKVDLAVRTALRFERFVRGGQA